MKLFKNVSKVVIISSAMMVLNSFSGFADVAQTGVTAESLMNNYKQKIISANTLAFSMTTSRDRVSNTNGVTDQFSRTCFDKIEVYEDRTRQTSFNDYATHNGEVISTNDGTTTAISTFYGYDWDTIENSRFFIGINYKGNETLSLNGNEYLVTGYLTKDELFPPEESGRPGRIREDHGILYMSYHDEGTDNIYDWDALSIDEHLSEILDNEVATYECRFDAVTGDLISLKIDSSQLFNYRVRQLQSEGTTLQVQAITTIDSITINDPNIYIEDYSDSENDWEERVIIEGNSDGYTMSRETK